MLCSVRQLASKISMAILGSVVSGIFAATPAHANVVSFQEWKTGRIEEAKSTLDKIQQEKSGPSAAGKDEKKNEASKALNSSRRLQKSPRADQRLQQAQVNLEVAQELTVNDYFVIYLSQLKDRDSLVEAARKLTPEEAAEILLAYQKQLVVSDPVQIVVPTAGSPTPAPVNGAPAKAGL